MKNIKVKTSLLGLLMMIIAASCNSKSGKGADMAGFFGDTGEVDIERLQNDLSAEIVDSSGVTQFLEDSDFPTELSPVFLSFYKDREYLPAWTDEDGITPMVEDLLEAIKKSSEHGLSPEDYKLAYLEHLKKKLDQEGPQLKNYQKLDKELTAAYLKLANHLLRGRIDPQSFDELWITNRREKDLAKHLQEAIEEKEVQESLQMLAPQYDWYSGLKEALLKYEKLEAEHKNWPVIPKDLKLTPGDSSSQIPVVANMLFALGDLKELKEGKLYGEELAAAVISFQERNGLAQDSIIGGNTISMLNISPAKRVEQIKLNLERYRWLPEQPEGRHILVNIPEYRAYVYEGSDSAFSMKVIVGKAFESTTPVFNDTMEYISFSPTWTVPVSIATEEMLPALCEDPNYLAKRDFKLYESWAEDAKEVDAREINWKKVKAEDFPYRIVQNPGKSNSLGRVKFMFPNKLDIYLHDTPADYLFDKTERDFSHGCIRVEKPVEFAHYLLEEQKLSKENIIDYMSQPEPLEVPLLNKVPILIEYFTAWMGPNGRVNFREDIYGHDSKQLGTFKEAVAESEKIEEK